MATIVLKHHSQSESLKCWDTVMLLCYRLQVM